MPNCNNLTGAGRASASEEAMRRAVVRNIYRQMVGLPTELIDGTGVTDPPVDWAELATYLGGCGLAGKLASAEFVPCLPGGAPKSFAERLQQRALGDALRDLSHQETLDLLHDALQSVGTRGILLKGAGLSEMERGAGLLPLRVPGDIDIWVENEADAVALRAKLLELGFCGEVSAPRTGPHHLAPITWRNSAVEIHTDPMPSFWGLPQAEFSARAMMLKSRPAFAVLDPAAAILHGAVHSSSHLYSYGLKLALDLFRFARLQQQERAAAVEDAPMQEPSAEGAATKIAAAEGGEQLSKTDWGWVAAQAKALPAPLAFWVPVVGLGCELGRDAVAVPAEFWESAPARLFKDGAHDRPPHNCRALAFARARLLSAGGDAETMNPFVRNAIFLLLHETWASRGRYLAQLRSPHAAESRRTALKSEGGQSWRRLPEQLFSGSRELLRIFRL